ncbi:McrB family protein [Miniimonas sp. S16]|uniref:McrB family protein n=1 Tax=Miniimonas sp. S16 TaxID=2171623 RepID=UPI000D525857|nr:AAA family ATPase [Miniimonas sp. S16]
MSATVPGTRRTFAGSAFDLADSPDGYLLKRDSRMLHVPNCPHEPTLDVEPWTAEQVETAWRNAPDLPLTTVTDPRFCTTCVARSVPEDLHSTARIAKVSAAARVVLDHLFGDRRSVIDPMATIWTAELAETVRAALEDSPDAGGGSTFERLHAQLAQQQREVVLLAAELVYLRGVPLAGVSAAKKLEHVTTVLSWLADPPPVPTVMVEGASTGGTFKGGQGYNTQMWQQIAWLAAFVARWARLDKDVQSELLSDPWTFRGFLGANPRELPSMRNAFAFMVFPGVFDETINEGHKYAIRRAFADLIGGPSGKDAISLDRDLHEVRMAIEAQTGERISWYLKPWRDHWYPEADILGDRAWAVRPRPGGRELAEQWVTEGFVSLAAAHLGEVPAGAELAEVRSAVGAGYDHQDYAQQYELTNDYFAFLSRMTTGDIVLARSDEDVWVGRITGEPSYFPEAPRLRREVEWDDTPRALAELPPPVPALLAQTGTLLDLTAGRGALDALIAQQAESSETPVPPPLPPARLTLPRATPELAARLHMPQPWLGDLISTLDARRQVVLYGPPGTGKTFTARAIARHVAGDGVRVVQFHPSYAYEDFFEGFRPAGQADGRLSFELRPGPLRQIAALAADDPTVPWVLVIDEINRGNIAKIFGELYFLLEYRDAAISLQYSSDREFRLPENLYLIGTMNTADRSIAIVDAAIRRRFAFLEMHPDTEPVGGLLERWLEANLRPLERAALLRSLNAELGQENRDFQIGPSYLMRADAETEEGLQRIWRYDLLPLLEEQFYGRLSPAEIAERFGLDAVRRRTQPTVDRTIPDAGLALEVGDGAPHAPSS